MANAQQLFERAYGAQMRGDFPGAIALYQKALAKNPKHGDATYMLGTLLASTGKVNESIPILERANQILPGSPMVKCNLGLALKMLGRFEESEKHFKKAIAIDPDLVQALNNLSALLIQRGFPCEAEQYARRCVQQNRENTGYAFIQLANALADQGRIDEAIATLDQTLEHEPANAAAWDNMLSFCHYSHALGRNDIIDKHKCWAARFPPAPDLVCAEPKGKIRIGYLSPDFCFHPVGILMEPILAAHDKQRFEIFLYHDRPAGDAKSAQLQALADHWIPVSDMSDAVLSARIKSDGIDVLVDLCGHLAGNRLPLFATRSAPVQVSYLGYPGSTGLAAMDYAVSDIKLDPVECGDTDYTESIVRLNGPSFAFLAPSDAQDVIPSQSEVMTFGSFNNTRKISGQVLQTWIEILRRAPSSRLIFQAQGLGEPARCAQIKERFSEAGIAPERIEFHGFLNFADHLQLVSRTDLCLDAWPWNGHMTTLNCLWMGVPVLTLAGDRRSSRMGECILADLGLEEFVARSEADYVAKAAQLASERDRLAVFRSDMRRRMLESRLMDGARVARDLETAFASMLSERGEANQSLRHMMRNMPVM